MRTLVLLLCAAALAAQTPTPIGANRGVNFYSLEKEIALGAQIAAEYRSHATVLNSAEVNTYLDALGQQLAAQTPAPRFTYTFQLVDDQLFLNEPTTFPGGPVFVPADLILAAADEDELAGMLAHAIAHIATRQSTREITKGQIVNYATIPLIYMGGWSGTAIRQGTSLSIPLGFLEFHRKGELQADQFAATLLSSAGYDPQALVRYLEREQPADPTSPNVTAPYPPKIQRIGALEAAIQELPPTTYSAHPGLAAIQEIVAPLMVRPAKTPPRLAR